MRTVQLLRTGRLLRTGLMALGVLVFVACGGSNDDSGIDGDDVVTPNIDVTTPNDGGEQPQPDIKPIGDALPDDDAPVGACEQDGDPCDDEDPCTENDTCSGGICRGEAKTCDDGDPCTDDTCDGASGECVFAAASGESCDDGNACTLDDTCVEGVCTGVEKTCPNDEICMNPTCDPATGQCSYEPAEGEACDDGLPCTVNDVCDNGVCRGETQCDDGVGCTNDVCTPDGECIHVPEKGNCDDGNPCTADYCDPQADCQHFGIVAAQPAQDGSLNDWQSDARLAENLTVSNLPGSELQSVAAQVSNAGLHIGVRGTFGAEHAWLVYLDLDYASTPDGTGVRDLSTIAGATALDEAASADLQIDAYGFGAEVVVGGIGFASVFGTADSVGCRDIRDPDSPVALDCVVDYNEDDKSIEIRLGWQALFGADLANDASHVVAGVALVRDTVSGDVSNQILPQQNEPIEDVFVFPVAGGICLEPFCGDGVVDPGEACDDDGDDCVNCQAPPPGDMVVVPEGEFIMGQDTDVLDDPARPAHAVRLDAYFIDKYEVTNAEFAAFLNETNMANDGAVATDDVGNELIQLADTHSLIGYSGSTGEYVVTPGYENHPVGETFWWGAYRYCEWVGKRLPTEAEWEKAARGMDEYKYPWGNEFQMGVANCQTSTCFDDFEQTCEVGQFEDGVSPMGVYDMAGNVWEWVNDWFDPFYYADSPYHNPQGPCDGATVCTMFGEHIARGGSWDDSQDHLASTFRYAANGSCNSDIGFRCAVSVDR